MSGAGDGNDPVELAVDAARDAAVGSELYKAVKCARVLVVGAGGIGCELLKNLVLTGFCDIEVVDLDTIDVSNLNRQFLFRQRHVGQPKAVVAKEAVLQLNKRAKIIAHHDNIKAPKFGLDYYKTFTIVMNALDNLEARRHVNRMCLATNKPMIDAGTTGYTGQVLVVKKGESSCYECQPKPTQKVYPICTIRSTPDKPVHCIVWAKEAFKLLFGQADNSMLYEAPDAPEPSAYMNIVRNRPPVGDAHTREVVLYGVRVLRAMFYDEIHRKVSKGMYSKAQSEPVPTAALAMEDYDALVDSHAHAHQGDSGMKKRGADWTQQVWSDDECVTQLLHCFQEVYCDSSRGALIGSMDFDKDDTLAMRFVTAATNLRARAFNIPPLSYHDAKGIAGNIIPAIATTNAMAAGLQVLEALKILAKPKADINEAGCRITYISREGTGRKKLLLSSTPLLEPSPKCFVCKQSGVDLLIDTNTTTLQTFVEKVLKGQLGFAQPSVSLGVCMVYEEGDGADEQLAQKNLPVKIAALPAGGIRDQRTVEVEDFSQDLSLQIHVYHRDESSFDPDEAPEMFVLGSGIREALAAAKKASEAEANGTAPGAGSYDRVAVMEEDDTDKAVGKKRQREEGAEGAVNGAVDDNGRGGKKGKTDHSSSSSSSGVSSSGGGGNRDVLTIDDDEDYIYLE